jgi:hypothetical protein
VYVDYNGATGYIAFTAAPKLAILPIKDVIAPIDPDTLSNLTTIDIANTGNYFATDGDIVLQFNLPITAVDKAELWYKLAAGVAPSATATATATVANLRADGTVLTIPTPYLLAQSSNYVIKLKVSSGAQTLEYNSDTGGTANSDIAFRTTATAPALSGTKKQAKPIGGFALDTTGTPPPVLQTVPVPKGSNFVRVIFTAPVANFRITYTVYVARQGNWGETDDTNSGNNGNTYWDVAQGSNNITAPATKSAQLTVDLPDLGSINAINHYDAEKVQYKVRGISPEGYVTDSNILDIDFSD